METTQPGGPVPPSGTAVYRRVLDVDEEPFEGELLLLHRTQQTVIVLNPVAAVLWEALQWPLTRQDLADLLTEAHPELPPESALAKVSETLELLHDNEFVTQKSE
jgi:hypothetical protein